MFTVSLSFMLTFAGLSFITRFYPHNGQKEIEMKDLFLRRLNGWNIKFTIHQNSFKTFELAESLLLALVSKYLFQEANDQLNS